MSATDPSTSPAAESTKSPASDSSEPLDVDATESLLQSPHAERESPIKSNHVKRPMACFPDPRLAEIIQRNYIAERNLYYNFLNQGNFIFPLQMIPEPCPSTRHHPQDLSIKRKKRHKDSPG